MTIKKRKIKMASQEDVQALAKYVRKILDALGCSEALVTDESQVYHFMSFSLDHNGKILFSNKKDDVVLLGMTVKQTDYIVDVARRLKEREDWEGKI